MANKSEVVQPKSVTVLDPAEYLFQEKRFHDCHITVGIPGSDEIETIPVVTSHLVAHSTVFRDMLLDSELADPTGKNTHITDVRPEIFKIMLAHMYGGCEKELENASKETVLEVAVCADKYNVQPLVRRACQQLIPTGINDVFVALHCVAYVPNPVLVEPVTELVQVETHTLVQSPKFLELDENCIEFITKQEKLSITEVELWRSLVKWSKHQSEKNEQTLRQVLRKPLMHVRLATFTEAEVVDEVVPVNIFTSDEIVDLLIAIKNRKVENTNICSILNKRLNLSNKAIYSKLEASVDYSFLMSQTLSSPYGVGEHCFEELNDYQTTSSITVTTANNFSYGLIKGFTFKTRSYKNVRTHSYSFSCDIQMFTLKEGYVVASQYTDHSGTVVSDVEIEISLKNNNNYFTIEPNTKYKIVFNFTNAHPVHKFVRFDIVKGERIKKDITLDDNVYPNKDIFSKIMFRDPVHVWKMNYQYT